jgi:hypothetical protein
MNITATWRTALLSGLWTGLGMLLFEGFVVRGGVAEELRPYYFVFGGIPFFWLPVFIFVFGSVKGEFTKHMFESVGRLLCWIAGAALVLMPGLPLIASVYAS